LLYNNGYDSIEKLKKAKIQDLEKIDGITSNTAKNILKEMKTKSETKKTKAKPQKKEEVKEKHKKVEKKEKTVEEKLKKQEEKPKEIEIKKEEKILPTEKKEEYKVKKKPKLNKELEERLRLRKQIKNRKPEFLREEWFRYGKLSRRTWRKPDGLTSKMRLHKKYRPSVVRIGFRGPRETRGFHSSGFEEVFVYNVNDLTRINPDKQAARIGSSVGTKKRLEIQKKAEELDIRILNL